MDVVDAARGPGGRAGETAESGAQRWARPVPVRLGVLLVLVAGVLALTQAVADAVGHRPVVDLLVGLASAVGALAVYAWVVRRLEGRRPAELEPTGAPRRLVRGGLLGFVLFTATIGIVAAIGGYRVDGPGSVGALVAAVGAMSAVAVDEELLFRGVVFRLVEERLGTWWALGLSAAVFAALHLLNPHATAWGAAALAVEAGAMLAAAYAATRTLWLPIGIHLGWNLAEGAVYGTTVSGSAGPGTTSLLLGVVHGPTALTGGSFGPEAGIPAILVCAAPTVLLLRRAAARGRVRPRRSGAATALTSSAR